MSLEKSLLLFRDFTRISQIITNSKPLKISQTINYMDDIYLKEESYKIIGLCMEVHRILGKGHSEVVYKDALEYEFKINSIPFEREKIYEIEYKEIILPRKYVADFVVYDEIIFEVKAISQLTNSDIKQTLNYLASSKNKLGLLTNFGEDSLKYKRIIL